MKLTHAFVAMVVINLGLVTYQLARGESDKQDDVAPVLRGRALELVDEQGRVRAEIKVHGADPNVKMPDGSAGYPESVLLRLIDSKGGPNVKLTATEDGSGMSLGGEGGAYVQILSRDGKPFVKIVGADGREKLLEL